MTFSWQWLQPENVLYFYIKKGTGEFHVAHIEIDMVVLALGAKDMVLRDTADSHTPGSFQHQLQLTALPDKLPSCLKFSTSLKSDNTSILLEETIHGDKDITVFEKKML